MTDSQGSVAMAAGRIQLSPSASGTPIEPRPDGCVVPLTAEQRYFLKDFITADPESEAPRSVRMCASANRMLGPLNLSLLEASIAGLVRRHESLRTRFRTIAGATTHCIDPPTEYTLTCVDLSGLSKSDAEAEAKRLVKEFQNHRIDLSVGPAFEARVFKLSTEEHVLVLLADHMISDGMSNVIMDKEIWQAYDNASSGGGAMVPPPPVQFADYAVWHERERQSTRMGHEDYWRRQGKGALPAIIPVVAETEERSETATHANILFGSELTTRLREFAKRQDIPLSNVTLMLYATAMSLWCDREDLVIRCPVHGRHGRPELKNVVGFFSSYTCLRIKVDRKQTLQGLLAHVQAEVHNALAYRDFDRMRELMPECVKTELEFHWRSARSFGRGGEQRVHPSRIIRRQPFRSSGLSEMPLKFWCIFNEVSSDICVSISYRASLLRPAAATRFGNDMRWIAQALLDRPLQPLDQTMSSRGCGIHDSP